MNQERTLRRPEPRFQNKRPEAAKKPNKRQLDSHEHVLLTARRNGAKINVGLMNGEKIVGVVTDFDRFSFSVRTEEGVELCFFKHGVSYFHPVQ